MLLSRYFSLAEMTDSQTAARFNLENVPGVEELTNLRHLCETILDPIRERAGGAIIVSSGYRSPKVNARIGGARMSQHVKGEAADIKCSVLTQPQLFELIRTSGLPFDQLIDEFSSWVHVSYTHRRPNRGQVLVARRIGGKTVYSPYK